MAGGPIDPVGGGQWAYEFGRGMGVSEYIKLAMAAAAAQDWTTAKNYFSIVERAVKNNPAKAVRYLRQVEQIRRLLQSAGVMAEAAEEVAAAVETFEAVGATAATGASAGFLAEMLPVIAMAALVCLLIYIFTPPAHGEMPPPLSQSLPPQVARNPQINPAERMNVEAQARWLARHMKPGRVGH